MSRKQIENRINTHQARLDRVIAILNENYADFEEDDNQTNYEYWIGEFSKEKQILTWLNAQLLDNE